VNRTMISVALISCLACGGAMSPLPGQTPTPSIEQQLRKQYAITRVGTNGVVVQEGTVLTVQADGIKANPASYLLFWPNNYKKGGGRVKQPMIATTPGISQVNQEELRFLQVGEKVYLVQMETKNADVVLSLQSCCGANQDETPYRAKVSFQLGKGYLNGGTFKDIQDTIGQVFAIDAAVTGKRPEPPGPGPVPPPPASLRLPATYASAQASADQLQLNADNSFSLQEGGQAYHGTFAVNGNTLELSFSDPNIPKNTATIQGNNLTDSSRQTWVLREQPAGTAPGGTTLQNEDVINMVKAGRNDVFIIARINASNCQFETSTDALIRLKQNGVSSAVLKAMIEAGK